jgi:hypothetical protein
MPATPNQATKNRRRALQRIERAGNLPASPWKMRMMETLVKLGQIASIDGADDKWKLTNAGRTWLESERERVAREQADWEREHR